MLREVGTPGEFAPGEAFESAIREGWGYWERAPWWSFWRRGCWRVTAAGRRALDLDDLARTL